MSSMDATSRSPSDAEEEAEAAAAASSSNSGQDALMTSLLRVGAAAHEEQTEDPEDDDEDEEDEGDEEEDKEGDATSDEESSAPEDASNEAAEEEGEDVAMDEAEDDEEEDGEGGNGAEDEDDEDEEQGVDETGAVGAEDAEGEMEEHEDDEEVSESEKEEDQEGTRSEEDEVEDRQDGASSDEAEEAPATSQGDDAEEGEASASDSNAEDRGQANNNDAGVDEDEEEMDEDRPDDKAGGVGDDAVEEEEEDDEDRETAEPTGSVEEAVDGGAGAGQQQGLQETAYSTRGRTGDHMDPLERLAREALGESSLAPPKEKDRESFLNDAITEEERRTRTRYIPAVDGMHQLRKHEIKSDLALARSLVGGVAAAAKPKAARRGNSMEVDVDESTSIDEDRSEILRMGTKVVEIGSTGVIIPSPAFVLPPPAPSGSDARDEPTPRQVEEVTAFNPPRPPESVGPKKKHRMLRWERRPADIEVDLSNYRKTVHRTRDELRRAEQEQERLQMVDNHLRRHFLLHLDSMSKEWKRLNKELAAVQQECVNSADLLTSRTRSRGAGKNSYAMRDVLTVLRSRGQEIESKGLSVPQNAVVGDTALSGMGGVNCVSFQDWKRDTQIVPTSIASCWILPGDSVATPYGDGNVVAVFGAEPLNTKAEPHPALSSKGSITKVDADSMEVEPTSIADEKTPSLETSGVDAEDASSKSSWEFMAPRVAVQLRFGVGFFPAEIVTSKEDPAAYSDTRLALRWKGIFETGLAMGSFLDVAAMSEPANLYREDVSADEDVSQDDDAGEDRVRLLPFGSRMLPTFSGRGAALCNMSADVLDEEIDRTLLTGCAVLGHVDNSGVPSAIRKMEDENQVEIDLRARALQLRNQLYRQRRVRMLNERTQATTQERAVRIESLVTEMRSDLKTLKRRLDEEIAELGITESEAEDIISAYYQSLDSQPSGEASPPKRSRRSSRLDEDEEMEEGEQTELVAGPSQ